MHHAVLHICALDPNLVAGARRTAGSVSSAVTAVEPALQDHMRRDTHACGWHVIDPELKGKNLCHA